MKAVGREGAFYKDITALHTRYVTGKGATHIALAYAYLKCAPAGLPCAQDALTVQPRTSAICAARGSGEGASAEGAQSRMLALSAWQRGCQVQTPRVYHSPRHHEDWARASQEAWADVIRSRC